MRKIIIVGFLAAVVFFVFHLTVENKAFSLDARQTFELVWNKYRSTGILYEKEEIWMIFLEGQEKEPGVRTEEEAKKLAQKSWGVKKMIRYLKYDNGLLDRMYIIFTYPGRESNTQFLIYRYPDKYDDLWMYSPVLVGDRKDRRIPTSAQHEDHFMGSALTYEDIRRLTGEVGRKAEVFDFSFIGGNNLIRVVPSSRVMDTGYSERRFVVDRTFSFTKVMYYKNSRLAKIQFNSHISFQNGLWRPLLVEMYDIQKKFSTLLYFAQRKILSEKEVPEGIFEISYLRRGR